MKQIKLINSLLALVLLCAGCDVKVVQQLPPQEIKVVKIDGCEYVVVESPNYRSDAVAIGVCHKGNCTNVIHETHRP